MYDALGFKSYTRNAKAPPNRIYEEQEVEKLQESTQLFQDS